MNILVIKGLTLPVVTEEQVAAIGEAAGPGSTVTVVERVRDAFPHAADTDVIFGVLPPSLFEATPKLQWVHASASGVDAFMYQAFQDSPVILTGEKGLVGGHLADTGFGLLLALTRQIKTAFRLGPDGWNHREEMRMVEIELEGMTMGVVGYGGTGRALARRAVAFGMSCLAVDEMTVPGDANVAEVWGMDRLHEMLGQSDVVGIGAPLTPKTKDLFDDAAFTAMRKGAIICNVTRGEIINGEALVNALRSGHLGGAALDVAPEEPLPADHPLWSFDNVAMTPHTAGASQLRAPRNIARFCENLRRLRQGEELVGVVDKHEGF